MVLKTLKKIIAEATYKALKKYKINLKSLPEIIITRPQNPDFGDWTTNIALILASKTQYKSAEIASFIIEQLKKDHLFSEIEEINGFINFKIAPIYYQKIIKQILKQGSNFANLNIGRGKKIQVEFGSANPTGPLHIGTGKNLFIGDTLANIFQKGGFKVIREYYVNDAGNQVKVFARSVELRYLELFGKKIKFPREGYQGDYPREIAKAIKEKYGNRFLKISPLKRIEKFSKLVVPLVIKDVRRVCRKSGICFDNWFFESSLYQKGIFDKVLKILKRKNLVYKKNLALWFKTSKFGQTKDDVIIRADGTPTYFGADIAYHYDKFKTRRFKKVINIWGADNSGNVVRLKKAVEALGFKNCLDIVIHQYVKLVQKGKIIDISKRKGSFVTLEEVIDKVGKDVTRFFMLMRSPNTHLNFNLDLAIKRSEKNPVYYIQYAYARICSILKNLPKGQRKFINKLSVKNSQLQLLDHPKEIELMKHLEKLPEVIERIINNYYLLHELPFYAYNLAQTFHQFYKHCRVLTQDEDLKKARLALIKATQIVFKIVFDLLGIETKEKM